MTARISSGAGVRGGQHRLVPYPSHPNRHFSLTQAAVTTVDGLMILARTAPSAPARLMKASMSRCVPAMRPLPGMIRSFFEDCTKSLRA